MTQRATVTDNDDPPADDPAGDAPGGDGGEDNRPEWLPEKFESPEDMAEAYGELESKLGEGGSGDDDDSGSDDLDDATIPNSGGEDDLDDGPLDLTQEIAPDLQEDGEISEETYERLEDRGISRNTVDTHAEGLRSMARAHTQRMADVVGGTDTLQDVLSWASQNLSEEQADSYNRALQEGRTQDAELALRGIYSQYAESEGVDPSNRVRGGGSPGVSGAKPFKSNQEVTEAMSDPKYKWDPAYRQKVADRLAVSEGVF